MDLVLVLIVSAIIFVVIFVLICIGMAGAAGYFAGDSKHTRGAMMIDLKNAPASVNIKRIKKTGERYIHNVDGRQSVVDVYQGLFGVEERHVDSDEFFEIAKGEVWLLGKTALEKLLNREIHTQLKEMTKLRNQVIEMQTAIDRGEHLRSEVFNDFVSAVEKNIKAHNAFGGQKKGDKK